MCCSRCSTAWMRFCGPLEVYDHRQRATGRCRSPSRPCGATPPITTRSGLQITLRSECDPGGHSGRARRPRRAHEAAIAARIRPHAGTPGGLVMSVCTGADLGRAGLLDGLTATTHAVRWTSDGSCAELLWFPVSASWTTAGSSPQQDHRRDRHRALCGAAVCSERRRRAKPLRTWNTPECPSTPDSAPLERSLCGSALCRACFY